MRFFTGLHALSLAIGAVDASSLFDPPPPPPLRATGRRVRGVDQQLRDTPKAPEQPFLFQKASTSTGVTLTCDEPVDMCILEDKADGVFEKCWNILAGQSVHVGTFCISTDGFDSNDAFYVTYNTTGTGWFLDEVHVWVGGHGTHPQSQLSRGIPANAQFPVRSGHLGDPKPQTYTATLPFDKSGSQEGNAGRVSTCCNGSPPSVYQILAHSKVYNIETTQVESGWGNATEIGVNWAMATNFTLGCDCPSKGDNKVLQTQRAWQSEQRRRKSHVTPKYIQATRDLQATNEIQSKYKNNLKTKSKKNEV